MSARSDRPAITDEEREQVRLLHAEGLGRNEIAERLGRGAASITAVARDLGLSFNVGRTADAVAVRAQQLKQRRQELEAGLLEDAQKLRSQLWVPHEYIDHGGKEFVEVRWTQDEPTPGDKLKLMQAAGLAIDRSLNIAKVDLTDGTEAAKSMLAGLFADVQGAWALAQRTGEAEQTTDADAAT